VPGLPPSGQVLARDHARPQRGTAANHRARRCEAAPQSAPALDRARMAASGQAASGGCRGGHLCSRVLLPARDARARGVWGDRPPMRKQWAGGEAEGGDAVPAALSADARGGLKARRAFRLGTVSSCVGCQLDARLLVWRLPEQVSQL
jgi:hypothetical protein